MVAYNITTAMRYALRFVRFEHLHTMRALVSCPHTHRTTVKAENRSVLHTAVSMIYKARNTSLKQLIEAARAVTDALNRYSSLVSHQNY